jgi:hypothetical protein
MSIFNNMLWDINDVHEKSSEYDLGTGYRLQAIKRRVFEGELRHHASTYGGTT